MKYLSIVVIFKYPPGTFLGNKDNSYGPISEVKKLDEQNDLKKILEEIHSEIKKIVESIDTDSGLTIVSVSHSIFIM